MAVVHLGLSEESFWRMTPRKLFAILRVDMEIKNPKKKPEKKFIDEVLF
jgi:hypothetical protein